jgi:hypothetical protein
MGRGNLFVLLVGPGAVWMGKFFPAFARMWSSQLLAFVFDDRWRESIHQWVEGEIFIMPPASFSPSLRLFSVWKGMK